MTKASRPSNLSPETPPEVRRAAEIQYVIEKLFADLNSDRPKYLPQMLFYQWDYAIHKEGDPDASLLKSWVEAQKDESFKKVFGLDDFENWGLGPGAVHHRMSVDLASGKLTGAPAQFTAPQAAADLMVKWLAPLPGVATSFTSLLAGELPRLLTAPQISTLLAKHLFPAAVPPPPPTDQMTKLLAALPWNEQTVRSNLVAPIWADVLGEVTRSGNRLLEPKPRRDKKPVGLTVQIDVACGDALQSSDIPIYKHDDLWSNIAGALLMLRRQPSGGGQDTAWRIATAAHIVRADNGAEMFEKPCVLPVRVPYRAGVRYPFLNYNQKSLVAPNPLDQAIPSATKALPHLRGGDESKSRYRYKTILEKESDHLRLTRLKYGVNYEVAACLFDVAGGLPDELTTDGKPWALKDDLKGVVPKYKAPIRYGREVSVGHVRVSALVRLNGVDLRLMPPMGEVSGIPTADKNLVIVVKVGDVLHFRIFDGDGKVLVDTDETRLTAAAGPVADLKKQLENLWPPYQPTEGEKDHVITAVASIVGLTCARSACCCRPPGSGSPPGSRRWRASYLPIRFPWAPSGRRPPKFGGPRLRGTRRSGRRSCS